MKRFIVFSILSCLMTAVVMAVGIDRAAALQKAQRFMPGKQFVAGKTMKAARAKAPRKNDAFYIFNAKDNAGFVIVSGDDRTTDILGYGEQGNLDTEAMPKNMKCWLEDYARQIEGLDASLATPARRTEDASRAAIAPLVTAQWDQHAPYNYMCPDGNYVDFYEDGYDASNRCITGCFATAMAQMMYYWKWPETCPALDSYTTNDHTIKGLPETSFKWNLMKDTYTSNETGPSADAVAELMRYCGQAVKMGYTPTASGGAAGAACFASVFQYSPNCRLLSRHGYSTNEWESIIYNELAAHCPVMYSDGGHEFIIDGYDGNGFFHLNWGWGGVADSYFVLSLTDSTLHTTFHRSTAFIGLKPAKAGEIMLPTLYVLDPGEMPSTTRYDRRSSDINFANITLKGTINVLYALDPMTTRDIEIGWGLFQDDVLVQKIRSKAITLPATSSSSFYNNMTVSFGTGLANGKYRLCQIYRFSEDDEWKRCYSLGFYGDILWAEVTDNTLNIKSSKPDNLIEVHDFTVLGEPEVGQVVDVKANITNIGDWYQCGISWWLQKPGSTQWEKLDTYYVYIDPGQSGDVFISFYAQETGLFNLKITTEDSEEPLMSAAVDVVAEETVVIDQIAYKCLPKYKRATVIRNYGIDKASIKQVSIPSYIKVDNTDCKVNAIDDNAFMGFIYLKSVTIPETVERIGKNAFSGCSSLLSVVSYMPEPPVIDDNTFTTWTGSAYIPSLATLYVPIGSKAKYEAIPGWTKFAQIEEGEPLEAKVGALKYSYASGGHSATVIQDDSYKELTEVVIPSTVTIDGREYKVTAIWDYAFFDCRNLSSLFMSEGLEYIGESAFWYTAISNFTLPHTLKTIGNKAFMYCDIQKLVVPEGVESIGEYAFACTPLTTIELPKSLKEIGKCIFYGNSQLSSVISHATDPSTVNDNTFVYDIIWNKDNQQYDYTPSPATLYVPKGTKSKYEALSGWTWFAGIEEFEESEDGITAIEHQPMSTSVWYNLQGVKIEHPQKGVYIVNGRKVVVR